MLVTFHFSYFAAHLYEFSLEGEVASPVRVHFYSATYLVVLPGAHAHTHIHAHVVFLYIYLFNANLPLALVCFFSFSFVVWIYVVSYLGRSFYHLHVDYLLTWCLPYLTGFGYISYAYG